jgi:hypothetical protein
MFILVLDRKILGSVEEVKVQVHLNTKLLQAIAKKLDSMTIASEEIEGENTGFNITFPISSRDALIQADDVLQSEENRTKLVNID